MFKTHFFENIDIFKTIPFILIDKKQDISSPLS